ncbi:MAG: TonB-dependent receptor [Bacteroidales bacterium]|jgi:TonB-linked SusC/RagA family outer membrane protein|nr:TonB-dependent receptor [Bacteroidales bacterium]
MRKLTIFLAFLLFAGFQVAAQVQITGTVTGLEDGLSIPGVSVVVKDNPTIGTTTDIDGKYSITVPSSAQTLVFTFVGMKSQEVLINNRSTINVQMENEAVEMDEVIVVAYGVQRKEAKTGAVTTVTSLDLKTDAADSPVKMLKGRMAGVQINSTSGQPGGQTQIRIRGFSSLNAGNNPLIVVDGVALVNEDFAYAGSPNDILSTINPNDIESMTVLKDASASSIYGSRAANGVILITTKRGSEGATSFNFSAKQGWSTPTNDNDFRFMNPDEILTYHRIAAVNAGHDPDDPADAQYYYPMTLLDGELTNWWDEVYQTGKTSEYELSVNGGNDKTKLYTAISYFDQEGIKIGTGLNRISLRSNIDHKVNKRLTFGTNISGSYIDQESQAEDLAYSNPFWAASSLLPWHNPYNEDGTFNNNLPSNADSNPLENVALNEAIDKIYKFNGAIYAEVQIMDGLKFKTLNSIDYLSGNGRAYRNPNTPDGEPSGNLYSANYMNRTLVSSNTLNYVFDFNEDHMFNTLVGYEFTNNNYGIETASGQGVGVDIPYLSNASSNKDVGSGYTEWALQSYFGRLDYNYMGKYFFTGSIRTDGSSRFGKENRYGLFWAVGASWNLNQESFMESLTMIDLLKLRASYGINGNDNIGNYQSYGVYGSRSYNGLSALAPDQLENPNLTWEENATWNLGLDFTVYKRFTGSFEYYERYTTEMLLNVPISRTTGFSSMRQNIGEMSNKGYELSLDVKIIDDKDLNWSVGLNYAHNKVELIDLATEEDFISASGSFWTRNRVGGGYADYYVYDWAGVNPTTGEGLWYDSNGFITNDASQARRIFKGQLEPRYQGGFNTRLSWKGISLDAFFEYKVGHYVYIMEHRYTDSDGYNFGSNQTVYSLNYWENPGDVTYNPKPVAFNSSESNAWATSKYLEKGDYLRFKNLSLAYDLPSKLINKAKINSARITFNIENVYVWSDVSYWDPERDVTGGGYAIYPQPRTYSVGLKLGF